MSRSYRILLSAAEEASLTRFGFRYLETLFLGELAGRHIEVVDLAEEQSGRSASRSNEPAILYAFTDQTLRAKTPGQTHNRGDYAPITG